MKYEIKSARAFITIIFLATTAFAQRDYTFEGLDSGNPVNFFLPGNWSCTITPCTFPGADDTARIGKVITGGYATFSPNATGSGNIRNLFILHGSALNFTNFTTTGMFNLGDLPTSTATLAAISSGAVFNNNGTMSVITTTAPGNSVFSGNFTFFNNGTFNLNKLSMIGGPTIVNQPFASIFVGDFFIGGGFWTFNNLGFLNKPSSPGMATLTLVTFINSGTVEAGNGTLVIGASGSTITSTCGRFSTNSPTGILLLSAPFTANACPPLPPVEFAPPGDVATNFFGPGPIRIQNNLTLNGADIRFGFRHPTINEVTTGNVEFQSDNILGTGNIRVVADAMHPTNFTWLTGGIGGSGSFDIESGGFVNISPSAAGSVALNGRTVNNAGTVIWTGGAITNNTNAITFNNQLSGIFEVRNNNSFFSTTSPQSVFNNAGIFRKSVGTGTTNIGMVFSNTNTGTVDVQSGTLRFTSTAPNNNSFAGTFNAATGGVIELASSSGGFNLNNGFNTTGSGVFRISSGANTTVNAPVSFSNLELDGGTFDSINPPIQLTVTLEDHLSLFFNSAAVRGLKVVNRGTLRAQNNVFFNNGSTLENLGIFNAPHNTSLRQQAGAAFNFNNFGNVNPGLPLGTLFMDGNYTQSATGTLNIDIGGTSPGTQHDQFRVFNGAASGTGTATLGGTLNANLVNGFIPAANDFFQIMTCQTACNGQFSQINGVNVGTDKVLVPGYGTNAVSLITTAIDPSINAPVLTVARRHRNETTIHGTYSGAPNTSYLISFYRGCVSGPGAFRTRNITTNANGVFEFLEIVPSSVSILIGEFISARATDASNLTSNLSNCTKVLSVNPEPDFDGDAKTDISVYREGAPPLTGSQKLDAESIPLADSTWHIMQSSGGIRVQGWGVAGDRIAPADFDGDGKTDIAVFRPSEGNWYVINSSNNTVTVAGWGNATDQLVPGDYNGDGKADFVVYRPSEGRWYRRDTDGQVHVQDWGLVGDKPAPADFDGDGKLDLTVFRPSEGRWYTIRSSDFVITATDWGVSGDVPVAADYSGDSKADFVVFRPSDLTWYRRHTDDNSLHFITWGLAGDIPVPGDYDGDGKTDLAVFRPANGTWYIFASQAGIYSQPFGLAGDLPTPNAFVY